MRKLLIPKIFHRIWIGEKAMPVEFVHYGETWMHYHPDWDMKLWTDKNMIKLQNQDAYNKAHSLAQKADIARYELIYRFGGIYIDCDFECLKNIENLIEGVEAFSASEDPGIVSIGIMGCTPGSKVFKPLIDGIPNSIQTQSQLSINYQTGPIYATRILSRENNIRIFSSDLFYPYSYREKYRKGQNFPNAYAVHHWAGSWI